MVQEIKKAFRAKYNKINLSNERLEAYATKWVSKIEDENAIEEFLNTLDVEPLEEIAKLDDALRAKSKQDESKPKDDELMQPSNEIEALKQQMAKMQEALENKTKSDLSNSRSEQLKGIPEELRGALKFVKLEDLSEDDFSVLKNDLTSQAQKLELSKSVANPKFGGTKTEGTLSADEKRYLESKKQKTDKNG